MVEPPIVRKAFKLQVIKKFPTWSLTAMRVKDQVERSYERRFGLGRRGVIFDYLYLI
jgi:hypothetical protein